MTRFAPPLALGTPRPLQTRIWVALLASLLAGCVEEGCVEDDDLIGGCEPCTYPAGFAGCIPIGVQFYAAVPAEALETGVLRLRVGHVLTLRVEAGESMRVVAWRSTNPGVAVVVSASEFTGELRALSPGRTQIGTTVRFKRGDCELHEVMERVNHYFAPAVEVVP